MIIGHYLFGTCTITHIYIWKDYEEATLENLFI